MNAGERGSNPRSSAFQFNRSECFASVNLTRKYLTFLNTNAGTRMAYPMARSEALPGFDNAMSLVTLLFITAQLVACIFVWKKWRGTREKLASVHHELSSLQGIVDVSRDAIIGVTTDGVIMSWNRGARGIYGYTTKEALGSPVSMLFDHRRGQEANRLFEKVTRGENVTQHETVHLKKGRTPIDVSLTICPIMDGKAITGASVVARDITERKRAAGSLAQQAAAMKASMDGMAIIDHLGVCIYLNDAYA